MGRVNIYTKDPDAFKMLQFEVRSLWFKRHGQYLSNSDLLHKSLLLFKKDLEDKRHDTKGQNLYRYIRTGLPDQ